MCDSRHARDEFVKELKANIKKAIPHTYNEDAEYEVTWERPDKPTESMFGSIAGDIATQQMIDRGIEKAFQTGKLDEEQLDAVRTAINQNVMNVMLARGAGKHQISRAQHLIEGYKTENVYRVFDDYLRGVTGYLSKARYSVRQMQNLANADADVKLWAFEYVKDSLRNTGYLDQTGAMVRSVATVYVSWLEALFRTP
jgi:hypothetical protein